MSASHRGSRRYGARSLPVPLCPLSPGGKERERKMRILRLRRARVDHKVSSAEMHVKRFKRAPEVSFALSFPSLTTLRSSFSIAPFARPRRRVNLFYGAGSCVLTSSAPVPPEPVSDAFCCALKRATDGTLHCLPTYLPTLPSSRRRQQRQPSPAPLRKALKRVL